MAERVLLVGRHLGEGPAVALVGDEHRVVAEAAARPRAAGAISPSTTPSATTSRPSGQRTRATVRKRAVAVGRVHALERTRAAWRRCRRTWRPRRRSGPSARPGAPPSASTSSPVSSASAGSPVASREGHRLEPGVALERVGVLDDVGDLGRPGHELDRRPEDGGDLGRLVRVGGRQHQPEGHRPAPSDGRSTGGTATISAWRSTISAMPAVGQGEQLVELAAGERHALGGALHLDEPVRPVITTFMSTSARQSST